MPKNKTPTKVGVHLLINGGWFRPAGHPHFSAEWIRPTGATLLRKMVSPFGPTATPPQPKNDHSGRFLNGLFESASLLRKYALPPVKLKSAIKQKHRPKSVYIC